MKFDIPQDLPNLILYIWKIINLPNISFEDLIFNISFEMMLFSPEEAEETISKALKSGLLLKDKDDLIKLSDNLAKELLQWQESRKTQIGKNLEERKSFLKFKDDFSKTNSGKFNILLKAFLDKGTLDRAATISDGSLKNLVFDINKGSLKTEIEGSKEKNYKIEISIKEQTLIHNCHDFETKRARNKKFCKHLVKLFLYLRKNDESSAISFLQGISKEINSWDFST
jgi:hypothetical protein